MNSPISIVTPNSQPESPLAAGNRAQRSGNYAEAVSHYLRALQATPALGRIIGANLRMAQQKCRADRANIERTRVAVCGWELAHNAAGRVYTLAKLYETFADVEIIGSIFPMHGRDVWEPIRNTNIPLHTFVVDDQSRFIEQAIELVAAHPYDIVHLSKPRAPNIFFGILYKLIWDAKVLVDIDDEELAFVDAESAINLNDYIKDNKKLPDLQNLAGKEWTQIAVGLAQEFDGVTVSNPALQKRYGGEIIYHARDERQFQPSVSLNKKIREKFNIPPDKKVILFFGTPRDHKGLKEIAHSLAILKRTDTLFVIVGNFPDLKIKDDLIKINGCDFVFIENQPILTAFEIVAIGDICILHQDVNSLISKYQCPAKLTDALAMGLTVIAHKTDALSDFFKANCIVPIENNLTSTLDKILKKEKNTLLLNSNKLFFASKLSINKNSELLFNYIDKEISISISISNNILLSLLKNTTINNLLSTKFNNATEVKKIIKNEGVNKISLKSLINKENKFYNNVYDFKLEVINENEIKGWVVNKNNPSDIFDIKIKINDVEFIDIKNNIDRADLLRHKKSSGKGGYKLLFPNGIFSKPNNIITLQLPNGKEILLGDIKGNKKQKSHDNLAIYIEENVSVIVPIYNAADDLKVCIERIIKYTSKKIKIILIDDCSTDKKINEILLKEKNNPNFTIIYNEKNLGFTKTVNKGIELAGDDDVVLLNSDARVTPRWLEGIRAALATDYKIATVTPMSDRAGAFSAPNIGNDNNLPAGVDEISYALAFRRNSEGFYPSVPTGNGFCMYIRRACIKEIGALDAIAFPRGYGEENDFCMRARNNGWRNVIDDRTYIYHDRSKSFGDNKTDLIQAGRKVVDIRYPDYKKSINIFSQSPLIAMARFRAKEALLECLKPEGIKPRSLFVVATQTGGTPQTNRDLMLALSDKIEPWLLQCNSKTISIFKVNLKNNDDLIYQYNLSEPVDPITHTSHEYDKVVANWLKEFDFEIIHIRHLAWHSINLPRLSKESGATVINSFHDFYSICPTVKLLDEKNKFCNGKCTTTNGDCKPDLWAKDAFPPLKNAWINNWRNKFEQALQYCDAFITTHESAKLTIQSHLKIEEKPFHVVPHGRDFNQFQQIVCSMDPKKKIKILVPGNISAPKGSKIIEELLNIDSNKLLEFHILGKSNINLKNPQLIFHGEYKRHEFGEKSEGIKPHVGAVFSIWNETWCHTLTELWSVGLPVIVFDFPTLATRVRESGAGWVFDHNDISQLYKNLVKTLTNEDELKEKINSVINWQKNTGLNQNTKSMADKYYSIYMNEKN
jgi:GT2 family glycosyltransferase/glycosyltransferase involved in cell wall biosynthesis